jgi:hypothetical protein
VEAVLVAERYVLLRLGVAILLAQTKVDQYHLIAPLTAPQQKVARLQIAMNDVLRVNVFKVLNL